MPMKRCLLLAGSLLLAALAPKAHAADDFLMITSRGTGPTRGIVLSSFDAAAGKITPPALDAQTDNCTYYVIAPDGMHLYALNSVTTFDGQPNTGAVSAFALDPATAKLTLLNQKPSGGLEPSYISLDKNAHFALIANYTGNKVAGEGGTVSVFALKPDGSLGERTAFVQHKGKGANPTRQNQAFAHSVRVDPTNKFALVADLGLDKVFIYKFDDQAGTLTPNDPPYAELKPASGPRHMLFHPKGQILYVLQEMGNTVTAMHWDAAKGTLTAFQEISTLPADFKGRSTAAEIVLHTSGKWLYTSNRGHDSIAQFAIDPDNGTLTFIGTTPSGGRTPRGFTLDSTGKWLLATNQDSGNALLFAIDPATGTLTKSGDPIAIPSALCPRFLAKP